MRRAITLAVLAAMMCGVALAETPPRQTAPYPASRPVSVAELQERVATLTRQVEELTRQVAEIRAAVAQPAAKQRVADADAIAAGLKAHKLVEGMTLDQVEQVTGGGFRNGGKGELLSKGQGQAVYRWEISNQLNVVDDQDRGKTDSYILICRFHDGKLSSFAVNNLPGGFGAEIAPGSLPRR